jgi:hypothetical protein
MRSLIGEMAKVLDYGSGDGAIKRRNWCGIVSLVMAGVGFFHGVFWYQMAHASGKNYMLERAFWAVAVFNCVGVVLGIVGVALPRRIAGALGIVGNGLVAAFWLFEILMLA